MWRQLLVILGAAAAIALPAPAFGAGDIELNAATATLWASDADPIAQISGALPLTLEFNGAGVDCVPGNTNSGTVTLSVVNGGLQVAIDGTRSGACGLGLGVSDLQVAFAVPDNGEPVTPVMFSGFQVASSLAPTVTSSAGWSLSLLEYASNLGLGHARSLSFALNSPMPDREFGLVDFIRGDSVSFPSGLGVTYTGTGSFSETYRLEASLPTSGSQAAVPIQIWWVLVGVLLGLGIKTTRPRCH